MSEPLRQRIELWVEANLGSVSVRNPVSNHLDEVLGRPVERPDIIDLSLHAYAILVDQMQKLRMPAQPVLVIPLRSESIRLEATVPQDLPSIKSLWRQVEPPSLYLFSWDASRLLEVCEEYRAPLVFDPMPPPIAGTYAYYREFRDMAGIENNWEFTKGVYVEYFPEEYR